MSMWIDQRGDPLGGRVHAERRVGGGELLGRFRVVVRTVAARVADRAVEHDVAVAAHAQLERGVDAGAVQRHAGVPESFDGLVGEAAAGRVLHRVAGGDGLEILGDADPVERVGHARDPRQAGDAGHAARQFKMNRHPHGDV